MRCESIIFGAVGVVLAFAAIGCNTAVEPTIPLNSDRFARLPEVHLKDGCYTLHVYERSGPLVLTQIFVKPMNDDLYIVAGLSASDPSPACHVFQLKIPPDFQDRDLKNHFLWRDPDGTSHRLAMVMD